MMDVEALNQKYKAAFSADRTVKNLENYVLSEIYAPIADYRNAVDIIRKEKIALSSPGLMSVEAYLCFTQLYCKSKMLPVLKRLSDRLTPDMMAMVFYLEALSFFGNKKSSHDKIKECLDKSISYDIPFVSNFLDRAAIEENEERKNELLAKAYKNIRNICSIAECKTLDETYFFDIDNYIDSEIKCIDLNEVQASVLFPTFYHE